MTKPKHTPGPWNYGEDRAGRKRVFDPSGHEVVRAMSEAGYGVRRSPEEREANGRLIAAAPDLLVALRWTEDFLSRFELAVQVDGFPPGWGAVQQAAETCRMVLMHGDNGVGENAIAKAEGRA